MFFILFFTVFTSCKNEDITKYEYYRNGNLHFKFLYDSEDTSNYWLYVYYEDTNAIKSRSRVENYLNNGGYFEYNKDKSIHIQGMYKNNLKNGVFREYGNNGNVITEKLFFKDTLYLQYALFENKDRNQKKMIYSSHTDNQSLILGEMYYDSSDDIIDSLSYLFVVDAPDTVQLNEQFTFSIKVFHPDLKNILSFQAGTFNNQFRVINDTVIKQAIKSKDEIECETNSDMRGYQVFTGELNYLIEYLDSNNNNVIDTFHTPVYFDYFVDKTFK